MNTTEGNKLIAEFMGVTPTDEGWYDGYELFKAGLPFKYGVEGNGTYNPPFRSSWDYIMIVVKEILKYTCVMEGLKIQNRISQACGIVKIDIVWRTVIEFIQWYNLNK